MSVERIDNWKSSSYTGSLFFFQFACANTEDVDRNTTNLKKKREVGTKPTFLKADELCWRQGS